MITLKQVKKTFHTTNEVHALAGVDLEIASGEIYGIIGFSGAGKSTIVRCINLLERPDSGKIIVDGKDLLALREKELRKMRSEIGMIFQHFNLMRSRTVAQNIAFPLKYSGLSKEEINQKVKNLLELVELSDKEHAYPSQLSGGQKQRVAIARAIANDPKVLLCDEATSALDPQTTKSILGLLKEVNTRLGITIVIITHEMSVVKEICDKVAIMEDGKIVEAGNILDIFADPKEEVTKNFIGSTNNANQMFRMLEEQESFVDVVDGDVLVKLDYTSQSASQALISEISRTFQVDANIIFGNIEIISNIPIGHLIVILHGEKTNIDEAIAYLKASSVKVEVVKQ